MKDLTFSISAKSVNPTQVEVSARNFKIIVDEPTSMGGTDLGANPVEYVIAALSGCLNVVAHVVAKEMNINLKGVEIDIEGDLNPEKFSTGSGSGRAGYKDIRVKVKPDTDADPDTLKKWLAAVESRCPVSDNIINPTPVKISLA